MLLIPELIFLYIAAQDKSTANVMYALYWLPVMPACTIFTKLALNPIVPDSQQMIKPEFLNTEVAWIFLMLNLPLWIFIYLYLDAIMPSEYGISKHPCFCFRKSQRAKPAPPTNVDDIEDNIKVYDGQDPILLNGLTKKFGDFTAVSNLKFSIKEGEVFTFLGHNGAGKTTTIYMLTGMLGASGGDASIYGFSINKSSQMIQKNLGLCQQFDVLFDLLTVEEHLKLVCELKNMPAAQIP